MRIKLFPFSLSLCFNGWQCQWLQVEMEFPLISAAQSVAIVVVGAVVMVAVVDKMSERNVYCDFVSAYD